jgi:hypothetical protein
MQTKYDSIPIDVESINRLIGNTHHLLPLEANTIEAPITMDELRHAVMKGKPNKAPGGDGISHNFYKHVWETIKHELLNIVNHMYVGKIITTNRSTAC